MAHLLFKDNKGFTLTEMVIAMALVAIVGSMVVSMMRSGHIFQMSVQKGVDAKSHARTAMAYISVQVRQNDFTKGIEVADPAPFYVLDSDSNIIGIRRTGSKLNIYNPGGVSVKHSIYLDSQKVLIEDNGTDIKAVAGEAGTLLGLDSVQFSSYEDAAGKTMTLTITIKYRDGTNPGVKTLEQTIKLRSETD